MQTEQDLSIFLVEGSYGNRTSIHSERFLALSLEDMAIVAAWWHACPRKEMTVEYYGQAWLSENGFVFSPDFVREQGLKMTIERYLDCNFISGFIADRIKLKKGDDSPLFKLFTEPSDRKPGEPVGVFELGTIPESHIGHISPGSSQVGFAIPRIFIAHEGRKGKRTFESFRNTLNLLDKAIDHSNDPIDLLAIFASFIVKDKPETIHEVAEHIFEIGIEAEENNRLERSEIEEALRIFSPETLNLKPGK